MVFAPGKQTFFKPEVQNGYQRNIGLPEQTPFSIERPLFVDLGIASCDNETAVRQRQRHVPLLHRTEDF